MFNSFWEFRTKRSFYKKNMDKNLVNKIIAAALILSPFAVFAQVTSPPGAVVTSIGDIMRIVETAVNWAFSLLLILAVLFIFYYAWIYMTAGGELEAVTRAKKNLLYAVIGIVIALLARSIIALVRNFLGA